MSFIKGFEKTASLSSHTSDTKMKILGLVLGGSALGAAGLGYSLRHNISKAKNKYDKKMGKGAHKRFNPNNEKHLKTLLKAQEIKTK